MARPRTPIGAFGEISFTTMPNGQVQARTRFRDDDGKVRRVAATGPGRAAAERRLKASLTHRTTRSSFAELSPDSAFTHPVRETARLRRPPSQALARTSPMRPEVPSITSMICSNCPSGFGPRTGDRADLRNDRVAGEETDPPSGSPKDVKVEPDCLGAQLHRRGTPRVLGRGPRRGP
jgi:hypothetical protein